MSEARRSSQKTATSDFSIERILADEQRPGARRASPKSNEDVTRKRLVDELYSRCGTCELLRQDDNAAQGKTLESTRISCDDKVDGKKCHNADSTDLSNLSWVHCTRYKPPKLPRRRTASGSGKRRPGTHPRIPFTSYQLGILEDKYSSGAYLSKRDVEELSTLLSLPQSRVKIWFQNRRAREKRENTEARDLDDGKSIIVSVVCKETRK